MKKAAWILVAIAIAFAGWIVAERMRHIAPERAIPADSTWVVSIDVERLRGSALYGLFALPMAREATGLATIERACGFDPLSRLRQAWFTAPEVPRTFAVLLEGEASASELTGCGQRLGDGKPWPEQSRGAFLVAGPPDGLQLAMRRGAPGIVGRGPWLETTLATAEKQHAALESGSRHQALRQALQDASVKASLVVPPGFREGLRKLEDAAPGWLSDRAIIENLPLSPATLRDVEAIAVGLESSEAEITCTLHVVCSREQVCTELRDALERMRFERSKDLVSRLFGFGPFLDSFEAKATGTTLTAHMRGPLEPLRKLLERARR